MFGFFGGGWLIGGVAGGVWLSWKIIRLKIAEMRMPTVLLIILSPLLLWLTVVVGMMPGMIVGIPYAIYHIFVIRKYNKSKATGEMSILEMNVYGKKDVFMHQLLHGKNTPRKSKVDKNIVMGTILMILFKAML